MSQVDPGMTPNVPPETHPGVLGRVFSRLLSGGVVASDSTRRGAVRLGVRVRMLARWVETSAEIVRAQNEEQVRGLLARFLRDELACDVVRFIPTGLGEAGSAHQTLELPSVSEQVIITLNAGATWSRAEATLARNAAAMTDAVLSMLVRLKDAQTQSLTDSLTGLYNRRSLERLLEREVLLASRHQVPLSVVALDIDHFKQINDFHGHQTGDEVLKLVASTITATLRRSDLSFRHGGDEFVLLLPQTSANNAVATMEKLRRSIAAVVRKDVPTPTLSIGVAEFWRGATPNQLLRAADEALYAAKRESRNCVRSYRMAA